MEEHPAYGHRRVAIALGMNRKPIKRVMKANGLKPKLRRGWRPTKPEDLNKPETRVENVLKVICPVRANVVWAGDFTYYSQFKLELGSLKRFNHVGELIEAIHRQIAYYNNRRIHSAPRMPPVLFKQKQQLKYAAYAAS